MFIRKDDYYQSAILSQLPGIRHGYSTRQNGDMRVAQSQDTFVRKISLSPLALVRPKQVHGAHVYVAGAKPVKDTPEADGVVSVMRGTPVGVLVGDCVPMLLVDIKKCIVAAVHAGWRGTIGNIANATVEQMVSVGCDPGDIVASIGPHIGGCCYVVSADRASQFQKTYGNDQRVEYEDKDGWHLDIGFVNAMQLQKAGLKTSHIETPVVCTSCQVGLFYSYRKDSKESFGEILAVVGFKE